MTDPFEIEAQGEHEFLVRLQADDETVESWIRVDPDVLERDDLPPDEQELVRRTVRFLLGHQGVADFPQVVEIEDVIAGYPDYLASISG
jgi:hypothetical protein